MIIVPTRHYVLSETGSARHADELEQALESLSKRLQEAFGADIVEIVIDEQPDIHWMTITFADGVKPWQGERADVRAAFASAGFIVDWEATSNAAKASSE